MLSFPPGKEATYPRQAVRQALSLTLGKEAFLPRQLLTFPLVKEAVLPRPLLTFLPGKEAVSPRQLFTFLLGKEAIPCWQLHTFLLRKEAVLCQQLPGWQLYTFLPRKEAVLPRLLLTFPLGKVTILPRQVNQAIKLGQSGNFRHSTRHRAPQASQENRAISQEDNPSTIPPVGFCKGLLIKSLILSGSLTFPKNL